jgi:hypothetical protein
LRLKELQVMMGSYGLNLFTPDAVRESGRPLSLGMLEIKELMLGSWQEWVPLVSL